MRIVLDTETDKLKDYTKLHCVVTRDIDTKEVQSFRPDNEHEKQRLREHLDKATLIVGHNIIGFDLGVLSHFLGFIPSPSIVVDTLVLSRLLDYARPGGHSLEAWGERFGVPKSKFNQFEEWSEELNARCISDTDINLRLYDRFAPHLSSERWARSIRLEHDLAFLCVKMSHYGFYFDLPSCQSLKDNLYNTIVIPLETTFSSLFPPLPYSLREVTPKETLKGTLSIQDFRWIKEKEKDLTPYSSGSSFTLIDWEPFNPASPKQIVHRLNQAGWRPINKTKGHIAAERNKEDLTYWKEFGWKVDEDNLATLPDTAPEATKKLAQYLLVKSRVSDLEEWETACTPLKNDSRGIIHGTFNPIGSWTQRMSHTNPNMANIPALINRKGQPQYLGREMRAMWLARPGRKLVGVDADAIQLRIFAHIVNDPKLIQALVSGRKEDGTDAHTLNKQIIEKIIPSSREVAKTYLYALFLGAANGKQSEILSCKRNEAKEVQRQFMLAYPGWAELKQKRIPEDAARGYFEGLDGRLVRCSSEHLMLAGYLQNGEKIVMARAATQFQEGIEEDDLPCNLVNFVHDELQYEVEDRDDWPEFVGGLAMQYIINQGEELELNCPLAANMKVGKDWSLTH